MFRTLLRFIYPSICMHCHASIKGRSSFLCPICNDAIEFKAVEPYSSHYLDQRLILFDYEGPIKTLLLRYCSANQPHLAKSLAAFLVVRLYQLNWNSLDYIVASSLPFWKKALTEYDPSWLLAKELSVYLRCKAYKSIRSLPKPLLEGKHCLLLKDQWESDIDFEKQAEILKRSGAAQVYGATLY